jgi:hypothetical protein
MAEPHGITESRKKLHDYRPLINFDQWEADNQWDYLVLTLLYNDYIIRIIISNAISLSVSEANLDNLDADHRAKTLLKSFLASLLRIKGFGTAGQRDFSQRRKHHKHNPLWCKTTWQGGMAARLGLRSYSYN